MLLGAEIDVADLIAVVLRRVHDEAARIGPLDTVTVTCPATWGPVRRATLDRAARAAGLPAPSTVAEPVAAAAHVGQIRGDGLPPDRPVLIYDLGAGTCDASLGRRTPDGIEVVASRGLDDVGGLDIDAAVVESIAATLRPDDPAWHRLRRPTTAADLRARAALWDAVRAAKEHLSRTGSTTVYVPLLDEEVPIGREQFDTLATPVLARTVTLARDVLRRAGVAAGDPAPEPAPEPEAALETAGQPAVEEVAGSRPLAVMAVVLVVLVALGALAHGLTRRDDTTPRTPTAGPSSGPPSPSGPLGDLVVQLDTRPGRGCELGVIPTVGEPLYWVAVPLRIEWRPTNDAPAPATNSLALTRGENLGVFDITGYILATYSLDRSMRITGGNVSDYRPGEGYFRLLVYPGDRGRDLRILIAVDRFDETPETDETNNGIYVRVSIPVVRGTATTAAPCARSA